MKHFPFFFFFFFNTKSLKPSVYCTPEFRPQHFQCSVTRCAQWLHTGPGRAGLGECSERGRVFLPEGLVVETGQAASSQARGGGAVGESE